MIQSHFTAQDIAFLIVGFCLCILSLVLFVRGKTGFALVTLVLAGLSFRLMMAFIDPFLNIWDEQFHALVAKNMCDNFFHPVLVANSVDNCMSPDYWPFTDTWVHKPPLFLWQMAIAVKIFGAKTWAIRIPSVIFSVLTIPVIYRCGKIIANERTGYFAALLLTCANVQINIVSGWLNTDHNDAMFAYYVFFSLWTWLEYIHTGKTRWLILMSCFAAAAVLTKWLPGLLVFGSAFAVQFLFYDNRYSKKGWLKLFLSLGITLVIAAPWFIYVRKTWPEQWNATLNSYHEHFISDIGHKGEWWFHFGQIQEQYGWWFVIALPVCIWLFVRGTTNGQIKAGILLAICGVFGFYSFVPVKMPFFCLPVAPLLILIVAYGLDRCVENIRRRTLFTFILGCAIIFFFTDIGRLEHYHTDRDPKEFYRKTRMHNREIFEKVAATLPPNTVIFNCGQWNAVACMFYTGFTAYDNVPSAEQIKNCKEQNRPVAVFVGENQSGFADTTFAPIILQEDLIRNGY